MCRDDSDPKRIAASTSEPKAADHALRAGTSVGQKPPTFVPPENTTPKQEAFSSERVTPPETNPVVTAVIAVATVVLVVVIAIPRGQFMNAPNQGGQSAVQSSTPSQGTSGSSAGQTTSKSQSGGSAGTASSGNEAAQTSSPSQGAASNGKEGSAHAGQIDQGSPAGSSSQEKTSSGSSAGSSSSQSGQPKLVADTDVASKPASQEYAGVSCDLGNLMNGGQLAWCGSNVYYANPEGGNEWVTKSIVRTQADGKKKDVIYEASSDTTSVGNINALENRLVFTETGKDKAYVVSVDSTGGDKRVIDECDAGTLCQVLNGMAFYQRGGVVFKCDPYGQGLSKVCEVKDKPWWAGNSVLYTLENDRTTVVSNYSSGTTKIFEASSGYYIASALHNARNSMFVLEKAKNGDGCKLILVFDVGGYITIWSGEGEFEAMCAYEDGIVLSRRNRTNSHSLFLVRTTNDKGFEVIDPNFKSELDPLADVEGIGDVICLSHFPGTVAFGNVSDNIPCSWNVKATIGGVTHRF